MMWMTDPQLWELTKRLDREFCHECARLGTDEMYECAKFPIESIPETPRTWGKVLYYGFRSSLTQHVLIAQIVGQRSDGQLLFVQMVYDGDVDKGDPTRLLWKKFRRALELFQSYRDCSCGILRHELTDELDENGNRIRRPVMSPCRIHDAKESS